MYTLGGNMRLYPLWINKAKNVQKGYCPSDSFLTSFFLRVHCVAHEIHDFALIIKFSVSILLC